jgi:hypothetical protein
MNEPVKYDYRNRLSRRRYAHSRRGISILEVLFSIGIATIGLFGVLVLIPFAVHQANIGLNIERSTTTGRNAMAEFEIRGYHNPARWHFIDSSGNNLFDGRASYVIDPSLVATVLAESASVPTPYDTFPNVEDFTMLPDDLFPPLAGVDPMTGNTVYTNVPYLPRISLYQTTVDPMASNHLSKAQAKQLVTNMDDIVFKIKTTDVTPENELLPATGEYFEIDGIPAKRQYSGDFSWMVMVRPEQQSSSLPPKYIADMVVMHQRDLNRFDRVFTVDPTSFNNGYFYSGGELILNGEIAAPTTPVPQEQKEIKDGDWIVLTNYQPWPPNSVTWPPGSATEPPVTYFQGPRWYRVDQVDDGDDADDRTWRLTIQGGDFFGGNPPTATNTYAIHVPSVLNVYQKTFAPETNSSWSISR